jgi:hypothetical protein
MECGNLKSNERPKAAILLVHPDFSLQTSSRMKSCLQSRWLRQQGLQIYPQSPDTVGIPEVF